MDDKVTGLALELRFLFQVATHSLQKDRALVDAVL